MWNSRYIIASGSTNKMYCLYHSFDGYSSTGLIPKCHHVSNLSTDYCKAVSKAKQIANPDWNLIITKTPIQLAFILMVLMEALFVLSLLISLTIYIQLTVQLNLLENLQ